MIAALLQGGAVMSDKWHTGCTFDLVCKVFAQIPLNMVSLKKW
jgi:hypothetical protein